MKMVIPDIAAYDAVYKRRIDKLPMYDVTSMFAHGADQIGQRRSR